MVCRKIMCFALCIGLCSTAAVARYTTILNAGYGGEPDIFEVSDVVTPISWGSESTESLNTNASGRRVDDSDDQIVRIGSSGGTFGVWTGEALNSDPLSARAVTFDVSRPDIYAWLTGNAAGEVTLSLTSPTNFPAYIVAFETGTKGDFQDISVLIETIKPIPAPGAVVLGGIGLLFVGWLKRRHIVA